MRHETDTPASTRAQRPGGLPRGRAALASVCLHGALLGLALWLARGGDTPPHAAPFVDAMLITLAPPRASRAPPAAPPAPAAPEPRATAPGPVPERAAAEPPGPEPLRADPPRPADPAPQRPSASSSVAPPSDAPPPAAAPSATPVRPAAPPPTVEPEPVAPPERLARDAEPAAPHAAPPIELEPQVDAAVRARLASWTGRVAADAAAPEVRWRADGQTFTAVMKERHAADPMGMDKLTVEVTTERDGRRLATELSMTRLAFSNFAQFIDRWDPNVQIHDDVIDGRFHANSEIRVSAERGVRPVFNGRVTLAARNVATDGTSFFNRRTMFPAGLETSVRRIAMPQRSQAFEPSAVPPERVQRLERDATLAFHADGGVEWRYHDDGAEARHAALGAAPFYFVAADDVAVHVSGTVNGQVLVYSLGRIVIGGDLRYADDPRAPEASDYLGLVAERSVEIDEPEVTGAGDLEIHASIYARGRFEVRSYRSRPSGTLLIRGSVTAGSVSATEPRYATRIEFDERLAKLRAPGFPLSDRYELEAWSGEWRVVPGQ